MSYKEEVEGAMQWAQYVQFVNVEEGMMVRRLYAEVLRLLGKIAALEEKLKDGYSEKHQAFGLANQFKIKADSFESQLTTSQAKVAELQYKIEEKDLALVHLTGAMRDYMIRNAPWAENEPFIPEALDEADRAILLTSHPDSRRGEAERKVIEALKSLDAAEKSKGE